MSKRVVVKNGRNIVRRILVTNEHFLSEFYAQRKKNINTRAKKNAFIQSINDVIESKYTYGEFVAVKLSKGMARLFLTSTDKGMKTFHKVAGVARMGAFLTAIRLNHEKGIITLSDRAIANIESKLRLLDNAYFGDASESEATKKKRRYTFINRKRKASELSVASNKLPSGLAKGRKEELEKILKKYIDYKEQREEMMRVPQESIQNRNARTDFMDLIVTLLIFEVTFLAIAALLAIFI